MSFEKGVENIKSAKLKLSSTAITLQKAIELGEYDPQYLSTFPEWYELSHHVQFQFIRQALDNRRKQLTVQWAEVNNTLNFSKKPYMQEALHNIEKQLRKLDEDWDRLYLKYSKV